MDNKILKENETTGKKILVVFAHPEPTSLTRQLVEVTVETLEKQGHQVKQSDLYGMGWKAVYDEKDFLKRLNPERLSFIAESANAYATGNQTEDVVNEQEKLLEADAVIFLFPLWWFGIPAIMKGWVERVYAFGFGYGYQNGTNQYRYGEGILAGKRALVAVMTGGPAIDYGPRGINGPLDHILFPFTHGALFYPGMEVLPIHPVFAAAHINTQEQVDQVKSDWKKRVENLFTDAPIPFRKQNGGDYLNRHTLADEIAPGKTGFPAHIAE